MAILFLPLQIKTYNNFTIKKVVLKNNLLYFYSVNISYRNVKTSTIGKIWGNYFAKVGSRYWAKYISYIIIYDALDRDIESPQAFRERLLRENGNRDEADVRRLFEAYHY